MSRSGQRTQKQNKSEIIRKLAGKGLSRADIARKVGVRYQYVRNVLVQEDEKNRKAERPAQERVPPVLRTTLGPDGRIVIPAIFREALGLKDGQTLLVSIEAGELRVRTREAALKRVQAFVRSFVPEGVSLADELIEDRRREEARERLGD